MWKKIACLISCNVFAFVAAVFCSCGDGNVKVPIDCLPNCGMRVCGPVPNGCGESCGGCADPDACDFSSGQCNNCAPDCSGRQCGPDPQNCGFSCGTCSLPDQSCNLNTGRCEGCSPDCGVRVCGPVPNGCGESCGSCNDLESCDIPNGRCGPLDEAGYYVSTNGNDNNPGTKASPWRTIQKAADTITGGQKCYVRGGTYFERVTIARSGSPEKYMVFSGYPGETVTIDVGGKVGQWQGGVQIEANWIQIVGFEIINSYWCGVWIKNSNNVIIKNCTVHDIERTGLYAQDSSYVTYDGNTVYNTQTAGFNGGQHNENVNMINVSNFEIMNNRVFGTANFESIDCKQGGSFGKVHHNDVTPNMSAGIYIDSQGQEMSKIDVYDNIIRPGGGYGVRGIAYAVEVSGGLRDCRIYNNIIHGTGAAGIVPAAAYSNGAVDGIAVVNNTVYNCGWDTDWGGGIRVEYGSATNIILRNNISYNNGGNGGDLLANGNTTLDRNLISINPNFVDPGGGDFHLQAGSPAIDVGSSTAFVPDMDYEGNARPHLTDFDIGAYEY